MLLSIVMIYSPGRNTTIIHTLTLYRSTELCRILFEHGNKLYMHKVKCSHSVDWRILLYYVSNELEILLAHIPSIAAGSLLLLF